MRVAIGGAGNVGRSIAQELIGNGHTVLLIERQPSALRPERVPTAEWILADCCEVASLQEADLASCDVVVAATGDDKVNLVLSLLAKTEFAVPRVVARVNRAENEWLFTEQWGVDVSVSKPRLMAALVEEAVSVGDLVRLMTFRQSQANLVEITLPELPSTGTYNVRARVTDLAGNEGASNVVTITVQSSSLGLADAFVLESDPWEGWSLEQLGNIALAHALDFDLSPGSAQGGNPSLVYNSMHVDVRPIVHAVLSSATGSGA